MTTGYGKILEVNLSTGEIGRRAMEADLAREYIGGMGFGCKILYDEVGPEVDPLGPDNLLIFATGPLTGTGAPCSARTEVTNKSPLTGSIGTGNTGGMWGTYLRRAGVDLLVIRGRAAKPSYLWIDDDLVELREAGHLWGKDTHETTDILSRELGGEQPDKVSVLTIGPAGEHLVRYACTINDYHHSAARGGAGAVMGSKLLKAIAVRGTETLAAARPEAFQQAVRESRERLLETVKRPPLAPGEAHPGAIKQYQAGGYFPYKNYQTGVLPPWVESVGKEAAEAYCTRKEGTCYACPISCFNLAEVKEGKYAGVKASRCTHAGVVVEWGAKCAIDNLPAIWHSKELCQLLGLDYVSASGVVAFAMELWQRGIITPEDTKGLELDWGKEDAVFALLSRIARREGFGDLLAEGSVRAAAAIGKGAEKYVMTIKGMEKMSADPRAGKRGWAFGELTNPRGGDNMKNTHFHADEYNPHWWVDRFDMFDEVKEKIYFLPPKETAEHWEGKPLMCRWFEDLFSILNALGLCIFPAGMNLAWGPTHLAKMFAAYLGRDTTPEEIMQWGEKIFTLLKCYTLRQGLTRKDDTWPDRFFDEPLPEGPSQGAVLSRDTISGLLDEYYELRGWDKTSGLPTPQKLVELGLGDVAEDLLKRGRL